MADQTLAEFAKTLAPQPPDKTTDKDRRAFVNDVIKAKTASAELFESGSWTHGTSIAGKSDVDYMAYFLDDARPLRPSTALTNLKTALNRFALVYQRASHFEPDRQDAVLRCTAL